MISGKGPSPPAGKAAVTSSGTPAKGVVVLGGEVLPQKRTPSGCRVQGTSLPNTLVISAWAAAGSRQGRAAITNNRASLRINFLSITGVPPTRERAQPAPTTLTTQT